MKLNTCNETSIREEKRIGNKQLLISSKGPKIDNYRKMRNKFHYFRFVILSHNRFWGQIVEPIVETGLYPDLPISYTSKSLPIHTGGAIFGMKTGADPSWSY
jgi:hypothetical protein